MRVSRSGNINANSSAAAPSRCPQVLEARVSVARAVCIAKAPFSIFKHALLNAIL